MSSYTIAIIGRPNVGKSTLFNRLVGQKLALVDDTPGVTRDRREGAARLGDLEFTIIDTAGLDEGAIVRRQTHARIDDEEQRVGECNRRFGLLLHTCGERALGALVEAGGVDDGEVEITKARGPLAAVAGDAGRVIDKRQFLPDQSVEQRGLADIGAADNGNRIRRLGAIRAPVMDVLSMCAYARG